MRRIVASAACAVALAAVPAAPASANNYGPDSVAITITGVYTGVLVNGLQVAANCTAVAVGAVSAIVIDKCQLVIEGWPSTNHPATMPLNAATSAFVERVTTLDFTLCYSAYAIPMTNPTNPARASGCTSGITGGTNALDLSGLGGLGSSTATN